MDLGLFAYPAFTCTQFVVAMGLYALRQPRRQRFGLRLGVFLAIYYALMFVVTLGGYVWFPQFMGAAPALAQTAVFSALAVAWLLAIRFCFDVSMVEAAFVCVAGYSTQNLADNVMGVIEALLGWSGESTLVVGADHAPYLAMTPAGLALACACTAAVYLACYWAFARRLSGEWDADPDDWKTIAMFFAVLLVEIAYDLTIKQLGWNSPQTVGVANSVVLGATKLFISLFLLFVEFEVLLNTRLSADVAATRRAMADRERQYRLSRDNIEAINVKLHDIRHQIRHLGDSGATVDPAALEDLARAVRVYDTSVKTGSEVLDTILTEKSLLCERENITFTCIADGSALGFMPATELYSLFGNAVDNAIEAVRQIDEPERRSISLDVRENAGLVTIHVENYYAVPPRFGVDGLPRTTKRDARDHGFGTKSMLLTARAHGGTLTTKAADGVFYLNILIPVP